MRSPTTTPDSAPRSYQTCAAARALVNKRLDCYLVHVFGDLLRVFGDHSRGVELEMDDYL